MWEQARHRARRNNIPFDIEVTDIIVPDVCPVRNVPLQFVQDVGAGNTRSNSPSLDRKDPALGYVKGNVIVVSWRANYIKSDSDPEELLLIANGYARLMGKEKIETTPAD